MKNKLYTDEREDLNKIVLASDDNYMFFLNDGKIILYQNKALIEIYIVSLEKEITGHYLLPEATKRYNYIFRHLDNGQVKFVLSVYYQGYYNAKPGGDDDRYIEAAGYYNLTDKCIADFTFSKELIKSMNFQKSYKEFLKIHTLHALEKKQQIILEIKNSYPETQNYTDENVLLFLDSITPNV